MVAPIAITSILGNEFNRAEPGNIHGERQRGHSAPSHATVKENPAAGSNPKNHRAAKAGLVVDATQAGKSVKSTLRTQQED
jgi:hypothetical protein